MPALVPAIVRPQACNTGEVQVPFRNTRFRAVADRNCVIARWCGEQREANGQSVVTRTRLAMPTGEPDGKAKPRPMMSGKPPTLTGQVTKRSEEAVGCSETESPEVEGASASLKVIRLFPSKSCACGRINLLLKRAGSYCGGVCHVCPDPPRLVRCYRQAGGRA